MWPVCCQYVAGMLSVCGQYVIIVTIYGDRLYTVIETSTKEATVSQQSWLGKCSPKSTKNNKYTCGNFKTMANFKNVLNYKYRSLSNCVINKTIVRNFWLFGGETIYRGTLHRGPSHGDVS